MSGLVGAQGAPEPAGQSSRWPLFLPLLILLASACCLMWQLDAKSLWIDELFTVEIAQRPDAASVIAAVQHTEGRPPLYYLLAHYWVQAAGPSDFSLRFFSVLAALPCLAFLWALARRLAGRRFATIALTLLGFSPLFLLYGRMARAYFLSVLLALAVSYLFVRLLHRQTGLAWLGYGLSALALLYTDYMTASILLAQGLFMVVCWRRYRGIWPRWALAQVMLLASLLPWLSSLLNQATRYQGPTAVADLSGGPLSYLVKLAQPALVFSLGETIFPWHPVALVALPLIGSLALAGAVTAWRRHSPLGLLVILSAVVPVLFTVFVVTGFLVRYMTFAWIGARSLQALPFYLLLVAFGLSVIKSAKVRNVLAAIIAVAFVVADVNYYNGWEFHNPVYVIPSREIVRQVTIDAGPGDVIVASRDSLFDYYDPSGSRANPVFDSDNPDDAQAYLLAHASPRVWLVTVSRDRGWTPEAPPFVLWLEEGYSAVQKVGYAEQAADYRRFKGALTGREAYQYKAEVSLYVRRP